MQGARCKVQGTRSVGNRVNTLGLARIGPTRAALRVGTTIILHRHTVYSSQPRLVARRLPGQGRTAIRFESHTNTISPDRCKSCPVHTTRLDVRAEANSHAEPRRWCGRTDAHALRSQAAAALRIGREGLASRSQYGGCAVLTALAMLWQQRRLRVGPGGCGARALAYTEAQSGAHNMAACCPGCIASERSGLRRAWLRQPEIISSPRAALPAGFPPCTRSRARGVVHELCRRLWRKKARTHCRSGHPRTRCSRSDFCLGAVELSLVSACRSACNSCGSSCASAPASAESPSGFRFRPTGLELSSESGSRTWTCASAFMTTRVLDRREGGSPNKKLLKLSLTCRGA